MYGEGLISRDLRSGVGDEGTEFSEVTEVWSESRLNEKPRKEGRTAKE